MDLSGLLHLVEGMPGYNQLLKELEQGSTARAVVLDAAKPYLITTLYQRLSRPLLLVTAQPEHSKKLYEQLLTWGPSMNVILFPEPETLPYENIALDSTTEIERLQALAALAGTAGNAFGPPLIIASAAALMQQVPAFNDFTAAVHNVTKGMEIEPFQLIRRWQDIGYRLEDMVELPGTISHRGGILDIYPPTSDLPARLEFFGNTIDNIRLFDPASQRSETAVSAVTIGPATELLLPSPERKQNMETVFKKIDLSGLSQDEGEKFRQDINMLLNEEQPPNAEFYAPFFPRDSLLDYLPDDSLVIIDEPHNIAMMAEDLAAKAEELRLEKVAEKVLPENFPRPYFIWDELESGMKTSQRLMLTSWGVTGRESWHELDFTPATSYAGQLPSFIEKAGEMLGQGKRLILVSHQASRLSELLAEQEIMVSPVEEIKEMPPPGSLTLVQGLLADGWTLNGQTHLLTDAEIFGFIKQRRLLKKRPVPHHRLYLDMTPGDYVVHIEHGIARFGGITTMKSGAQEGQKEYLTLEYAAGDRLFVPTDQIDRVGRYVGGGEKPPVLSRLGTQEWSKAKQKVKDSVADIAEELISLYATREIVSGYTFSPDSIWQQEMEASFPYVETPDQLEVQRQVKEDMESSKPMDRLVCGDVGYGKTEVAIRAAFKAVMDGKQVAVLVPTTVLAEQHFSAFSQRINAFPVRIEVLSRFRSSREQKKIIEGLASGEVDICIGTHRLIQKDIKFKELGLLIIDEEQRFGVSHKEFLKQMRQEVDVLTLSATPIPRTLHMSLVGVRDMSVMETPPEERLPIKTYLSEYNEHLIREAILLELERNGQVFFVHNRVQSIELITEKLRALVPEARISIAHGQMREGELEKVMTDFVQGKSDVLVCSSIIQSGLDMPNVNTMIINQADKFGLTQLHQLRGRVGRGANLAYAYLLYDRGKRLTPLAETRLRTIVEATELGAGFGIAMKDMEIRGAGSLLGMKQSGHISAVGFNIYCQLLSDAVEQQKARQAGVPEREIAPAPLPPPNIDLPLHAYIPEDYVTDLVTRLSLYQKLAKLDDVEQLEPLVREFEDRFGALPKETENLLYAIRIKILAARCGIESIYTEFGEIVLSLFEGMRFDRQKFRHLERDGVKIGVFQIRLNPKRLKEGWQGVLEGVLKKLG